MQNSNAIAPSWHDRLAGYIGCAKAWEQRGNSDICYSKGGHMRRVQVWSDTPANAYVKLAIVIGRTGGPPSQRATVCETSG